MTWPEAATNLGVTLMGCATIIVCVKVIVGYLKHTYEDDDE